MNKTVREILEDREETFLSKYAVLSKNTKGRRIPCESCTMRTEFQRDRDRILHSKAFRRLKHKTQVFITPEGDYYRTRLTHTLEVSQIARTIARALFLNEDLVEAMSLGHDLGHTPFGHAGEHALRQLCPYGFNHYEQSLRIVDHLENGVGLNLTDEVRDGILNHTGDNMAYTHEGQILKFADRIAYINHDIDDAVRGGLLHVSDLPGELTHILGKTHGERIDSMVIDLVKNSGETIKMSEHVYKAMMDMRKFLFDNVYIGSLAKAEDTKVSAVIGQLYEYFLKHPKRIPRYQEGDIHRLICDYIAGMSDRYAIHVYNELFVPKAWARY